MNQEELGIAVGIFWESSCIRPPKSGSEALVGNNVEEIANTSFNRMQAICGGWKIGDWDDDTSN